MVDGSGRVRGSGASSEPTWLDSVSSRVSKGSASTAMSLGMMTGIRGLSTVQCQQSHHSAAVLGARTSRLNKRITRGIQNQFTCPHEQLWYGNLRAANSRVLLHMLAPQIELVPLQEVVHVHPVSTPGLVTMATAYQCASSYSSQGVLLC